VDGDGEPGPSICAFCFNTSAGATTAQVASCAIELLSAYAAGRGRPELAKSSSSSSLSSLSEQEKEEELSATFNPSYVVKKTPDAGMVIRVAAPTPR
jgi:hypothetical protein